MNAYLRRCLLAFFAPVIVLATGFMCYDPLHDLWLDISEAHAPSPNELPNGCSLV